MPERRCRCRAKEDGFPDLLAINAVGQLLLAPISLCERERARCDEQSADDDDHTGRVDDLGNQLYGILEVGVRQGRDTRP